MRDLESAAAMFESAAENFTYDGIEQIRSRLPLKLSVQTVTAFVDHIRSGMGPAESEAAVGTVDGAFKKMLPALSKWAQSHSAVGSPAHQLTLFDPTAQGSSGIVPGGDVDPSEFRGPYRFVPTLVRHGMSAEEMEDFLATIVIEQPSAADYATLCMVHWVLQSGADSDLSDASKSSVVFSRTIVESYDMLESHRSACMSAMAEVLRSAPGTERSWKAASDALLLFESSRHLSTIGRSPKEHSPQKAAAAAARDSLAKDPLMVIRRAADLSCAQVMRIAEYCGFPTDPKPAQRADSYRALLERSDAALESPMF